MEQIHITLPDGSVKDVPKGTTAADVARSISPRLADAALGARVAAPASGKDAQKNNGEGELIDLRRPLDRDVKLQILTKKDPDSLFVFRHSAAHLLAAVVVDVFPNVKVGIGPPIDTGFFYEFLRDEPFTSDDLAKIEKKMHELAAQDLPNERKLIPKPEALDLYKKSNQIFKCELVEEKATEPMVSFYTTGKFIDFCLGPHIPSTKRIQAFKLMNVAGAYWKGQEGNPQLQRIYAVAFFTQKELDAHLHRIEEAKRRDHRKLGVELDLFSIQEEAGPGLIFWHAKGGLIRKIVEDWLREELLKRGYDLVYTPHIMRLDLWKTSGHTNFYKESMFGAIEVEKADYQLKPMNCPGHILIYKSKLRSYRDLPIRLAELGTVYRYERSGVLHGLLRVRGFTQDDAHLFCRADQIEEEVSRVLEFTFFVLKTFGFADYQVCVSTRPEKAVGSAAAWAQATAALEAALKSRGVAYGIDPGQGVFYGPKIDIKIKDVLGRSWQCSTVQVDFNNPERFGLEFMGEDGQPHRPIMIHRALMGSIERFFGILIEQYAGAFPTWLAPVQAIVIAITDKHADYARDVARRLTEAGVRVEADLRSEKIGLKIREAERAKIPYMLVAGDREKQDGTVSVRTRGGGHARALTP